MKVGDTVRHPEYGIGTVKSVHDRYSCAVVWDKDGEGHPGYPMWNKSLTRLKVSGIKEFAVRGGGAATGIFDVYEF